MYKSTSTLLMLCFEVLSSLDVHLVSLPSYSSIKLLFMGDYESVFDEYLRFMDKAHGQW